MKKLALALSLFFSLTIVVKANISPNTVEVLPEYLSNSKIKVNNTSQNTIKFKVNFTKTGNTSQVKLQLHFLKFTSSTNFVLVSLSNEITINESTFFTPYQGSKDTTFTFTYDTYKVSGNGKIAVTSYVSLADTWTPVNNKAFEYYKDVVPNTPQPASPTNKGPDADLTIVETASCENCVTLWRLYDHKYGRHLITSTASEAKGLLDMYDSSTFGYYWQNEGLLGYVKTVQDPGTVPLYRFYRAANRDHYFSTNSSVPGGYVSEGIQCYVYTTAASDRRAINEYHRTSNGVDHVYTITTNELAGSSDWGNSGTAFYVLK